MVWGRRVRGMAARAGAGVAGWRCRGMGWAVVLLLCGLALALVTLVHGSRDAYATLGVARSASALQIRKAFRKLAMKWHPDKNPSEKRAAAERRFAALGEAYETLSDPAKRRAYDAGAGRGGGGARVFNGAASSGSSTSGSAH